MSSPFLDLPSSDWVASNALAFAIRDRFPVSPGHTLVIPRRLVATWFEATRAEQLALLELVDVVKAQLDAGTPRPDGYNVGFNAGEAAGQTVMHLHIHVIPRYRGDMDDPRGGVRHVIPWRGNYLRHAAKPLATGGVEDAFVDHIRPLFARAREVAIVAAFVQDSGLTYLADDISSVIARGGRVRLITGDYLNITQSEALKRLLDWQTVFADGGTEPFLARVVETALLKGAKTFHPKSWRFESEVFGVAFVGSSNVSRAALHGGIEWNLRVDRGGDRAAYDRICDEFERLWDAARPLTPEWVAAYSECARRGNEPLPAGDAEAEPLEAAPPPHEIQREALEKLAETRRNGRRRALVVMATGLGKTLLAALDAQQLRQESGAERIRVLFLAHRKELLAQAAQTFRRVLRGCMPNLRIGWYAEGRAELEADVVVGSVATLAGSSHLDRLRSEHFDYVIVDEVHHAHAPSYRKILAVLQPDFLLGLTATPDRADQGDVLGLFDDNLVFRAGLDRGIEAGRLVPFAYYGLKDVVDYANIPWRNRKFDTEALAAAVQTQRRMERLWEAWAEHRGTRTLVFCCSTAHALFVRDWLRERGVRAAAVFASLESDDRAESLRAIERGHLDALCAVDLFNEGVDLPLLDRVVMLRPTESPVIFLQQLGRGLRVADGKERLTVIDFVGNHRTFLDKVRTLLSFGGGDGVLRRFLQMGTATELPPGCSVEIELEAIDLLRKLVPGGASEVERAYREITVSRGKRPLAGELFRSGYLPSRLREAYGSWFEFVAQENNVDGASDLTPEERRALETGIEWFRELETTAMTKSFKMVLLDALLEADALSTGMVLEELASRSHAILMRSPELLRDVEGVAQLPDPRNPKPEAWAAYWRSNPVNAWCGNAARPGRWFRVEQDRFVSRLPIRPEFAQAFTDMTRELVDYRLAQYRRRSAVESTGDAFECKITWNGRDPILNLNRAGQPSVPRGETDVSLPDGSAWRFRFMAQFCNVARPVGSDRNQLPDLLRRWFGPGAGRPGTGYRVRFARSPDGWWVEPLGQVVELAPRGRVTAFPSLRVAAGAAQGGMANPPDAEQVQLPMRSRGRDLFAVRATGDSMGGGSDPIRDGDWLVMRYARGAGLGTVEGRVALMQVPAAEGDHAYQLKRIVRHGSRWLMRSDNPLYEPIDTTAETLPIALLVEHVRPESLGPSLGVLLDAEALQRQFGINGEPKTGRYDGHLVVIIDAPGLLAEPDRVRIRIPDRRPGETAFVLARVADERWRYCGVGRWDERDSLWAIPDVDFSTWRALGAGRECSRRLPDGAEDRARELVADLIAAGPLPRWVKAGGKRCRIVGPSRGGGVRVDGGEGGFQERTVSLKDIAWVLATEGDVRERGGVLDEQRVNRQRYLDGTPKGSTRWIDTGWALVLVEAAGLVAATARERPSDS